MLTFNAITHTCNMGKHKTKTCNVCYKSMRGDNLKKHMKKHERGNEDNVATNEDQISCTEEGKEKRVSAKDRAWMRSE